MKRQPYLRYQFYWLVYRTNDSVKCLAQYRSYSCKVVTHSESDQAQSCLPSLTRVNTHTRSTLLYHHIMDHFSHMLKLLNVLFLFFVISIFRWLKIDYFCFFWKFLQYWKFCNMANFSPDCAMMTGRLIK